jgi:aspartyl protease family protein
MSHTGGDVLFYALLLVLPVSSLLARRLPVASVLKMGLGWIAIFALFLLVISQKERLRPAWNQLAAFADGNDQLVSGGTVRVVMAEDGHFYVRALVNGVSCKMLVDSGASSTSISLANARAAGIDIDESPIAEMVETANGVVVAHRTHAKTIELGGIMVRNLPLLVSPAFGEMNVIGMNFLSRLRSWRVEGKTLILNAGATKASFT